MYTLRHDFFDIKILQWSRFKWSCSCCSGVDFHAGPGGELCAATQEAESRAACASCHRRECSDSLRRTAWKIALLQRPVADSCHWGTPQHLCPLLSMRVLLAPPASTVRQRTAPLSSLYPSNNCEFPVCARLCKSRIGLQSHSRLHRGTDNVILETEVPPWWWVLGVCTSWQDIKVHKLISLYSHVVISLKSTAVACYWQDSHQDSHHHVSLLFEDGKDERCLCLLNILQTVCCSGPYYVCSIAYVPWVWSTHQDILWKLPVTSYCAIHPKDRKILGWLQLCFFIPVKSVTVNFRSREKNNGHCGLIYGETVHTTSC